MNTFIRLLEDHTYLFGILIFILFCPLSVFAGSDPVFFGLPLLVILIFLGICLMIIGCLIYLCRLVGGDVRRELEEAKEYRKKYQTRT